MSPAIAIVGMACRYPDARSPLELWENALAHRTAFRRLPENRFRLDDYYAADKSAPDKTYATEAAVIENYMFDRVRFRVAGSAFRSVDMTHWLALDVAALALEDAGFPDGTGLPKETTGVLVGNTLTGEFSRANLMRLRWPYVRRVAEALLTEENWLEAQRQAFLQRLETKYKASFPPVGEESLAGGMANTIAGRICNYFDLRGGGYTVDGACASSLLAVSNACSALMAGDLDVAIVGGVDLSLDPFELVGFAKMGALASEKMRVYDAQSAGFWPGEGCGIVILMRHEDAQTQHRSVYALIRGWGVSSDGSGGMTRPEAEGQKLALERAYRRAGYAVSSVIYHEGHGTGTTVGDAVELQALSEARRQCDLQAPPAIISSIKGGIGHTKAAAGVAGLIKATMAVQAQMLPPTVGCEQPHPELCTDRPALRVLASAELWPSDLPLRASVSAMGFGGINAHVTLEGQASERRTTLTARERILISSAQDAELFLLSGTDVYDLKRRIQQIRAFAVRLSRAELGDLAATLARICQSGQSRAALVAATPADLATNLDRLLSWLEDGVSQRMDLVTGVCLGIGRTRPRLGYLFPGQGAPAHLTGGIWARRFEKGQACYAHAKLPTDGDGVDTAIAQPAIVTASLVGLSLLQEFGLEAELAIGHSLGELTGLHWADVLDADALLRIAFARGQAMAQQGSCRGAMASLHADAEHVAALLQGAVHIACYNSARRTVISGEASAIEAVCARATTQGVRVTRLPVSHAFHSPLVAPAVPQLASALKAERLRLPRRRLISTVTGAAIMPGDDVADLLCRQVTSPVRFSQALDMVACEADLWIEVGPGTIMRGLTQETLQTPLVSIDAGGPSLRGLFCALAAAYVLGASLETGLLHTGRFVRPLALDWNAQFLANPCELAPTPKAERCAATEIVESEVTCTDNPLHTLHGEQEQASSLPAASLALPALEMLRQLVAERVELPVNAVKDQDRLLSDLHLNSISVSQIMIEAGRRLGLPPTQTPLEYADTSLAAAANALEEIARIGGEVIADEQVRFPGGVDTWVHAFTVERMERPRRRATVADPPGTWHILAPPEHVFAAHVREAFFGAAGNGIVVCLPPTPDERHLPLLLDSVGQLMACPDTARFVLVQHQGGAEAFAKTLFLEYPARIVCVVDVPAEKPEAAAWVVAETLAAHGYVEAHYDAQGKRYEPVLRPLPQILPSLECAALGRDDVLLVTGGGKGIAAECALAMARDTGACLLLMGRSSPDYDAELTSNLDRMAAYGVRVHYIMADVTDENAVRAGIQKAELLVGPVTALLHGAGTNIPRLLCDLDLNAFRATLDTKLTGARNVLAALNPVALRLFIAFGSLIARTGLRGEADYAVANAWLERLVAEWQTTHAHCRCLTVEWSVWSGVGMAERLGRIDILARQGITAISPDEGVRQLQELLKQRSLPNSIVVTGRYGDTPTLPREQRDLPFLRFLEKPGLYYPGIELVTDVELSWQTDPYLKDHLFHGEYLVPGVMALEAATQVAAALKETASPPRFEDVQFVRPIVVPAGERLTMRIAALQRAPDVIEVTLRSAATGFHVIHFKATCRFDGERTTENEGASARPPVHSEMPSISLLPEQDLYGGLLFHQGRFRRLKAYRHLRATECLAEIRGDDAQSWFGPYLPSTLLLGDPGARDAAIHAIQACIPHIMLLPVGIDRLTIISPLTKETYWAHAIEVENDGALFVYDMIVYRNDGAVCERWEGLRLHKVADRSHSETWALPLLCVYLERMIERQMPGARLAIAAVKSQQSDRAHRGMLALQQVYSRPDALWKRPDGKPELVWGPGVSISHTGAVTVAMVGREPLACDIETIVSRAEEAWKDLLGNERLRLAQTLARECNEDLAISATRIWTAMECLRKAGQVSNPTLHLMSAPEKRWVHLSSGMLAIVSYHATLTEDAIPLIISVLTGGGHAGL